MVSLSLGIILSVLIEVIHCGWYHSIGWEFWTGQGWKNMSSNMHAFIGPSFWWFMQYDQLLQVPIALTSPPWWTEIHLKPWVKVDLLPLRCPCQELSHSDKLWPSMCLYLLRRSGFKSQNFRSFSPCLCLASWKWDFQILLGIPLQRSYFSFCFL